MHIRYCSIRFMIKLVKQIKNKNMENVLDLQTCAKNL